MAKKLSKAARGALRKTDWRRVDAMTDADIARQIAAHADAAPDMAPDIDVRAIREAIGMTQVEFAAAYEFSVRTVQEWERGAKRPSGPARTLLRAIKGDPMHSLRRPKCGYGEKRWPRHAVLLDKLPFQAGSRIPPPGRRRNSVARPAHLIGGAYCRPPLFQSAFRPRLILIGEPCPTLRSKISP